MRRGLLNALLIATLAAFALSGCAGRAGTVGPDGPRFTFVQISDTHCLTTDARPQKPPAWAYIEILGYKAHWKDLPSSFPNLEHTIRFLNEQVRPDFVLMTGDLTENGNLADMRKVKALLDTLETDCHPVMGDHDLGIPRVAFRKDRRRSSFAQVFGKRCYAFDYGDWHFVVLGIFPDDGELEWLRRDLAGAGCRPTVVATHRLVFADKPTIEMARRRYGVRILMPRAEEVRAMLREHGNVVAVLSGHCHCSLRRREDDVEYLTTAALAGVPLHIRTFSVYADRLEVGVYQAANARAAREGRWELYPRRPIKLRQCARGRRRRDDLPRPMSQKNTQGRTR